VAFCTSDSRLTFNIQIELRHGLRDFAVRATSRHRLQPAPSATTGDGARRRANWFHDQTNLRTPMQLELQKIDGAGRKLVLEHVRLGSPETPNFKIQTLKKNFKLQASNSYHHHRGAAADSMNGGRA
jgi:hypothetical protein